MIRLRSIDFSLMVSLGIDVESQLQAHHVSYIVKHGGGVLFGWGCMTSYGMGKNMCKIEGKMTQAFYLSIFKIGS